MANKYWVGGTGTWNTTTTRWSLTSGGAGGAAAPTTNDAVIFNASSGGTYTVTLSGTINCNSLTVSAGTVTFAGAGSALSITGGLLSLTNSTVWTSTGNITIAGNQYVTCGTVVLNCLQFIINTTAGVQILLGSDLRLSSSSTLTLTQGILFLGGFNLYAGYFSSSGTLTRQLQFNSSPTTTGNVYLTPAGNTVTAISCSTVTGFTWTSPGNSAAGFNVTLGVGQTAVSFTFGATGGTLAKAMNLYINGGSGTITMSNNSWWYKVDFTGNTSTVTSAATNIATALTLAAGGTYTAFTFTFNGFNPTFTSNGKTVAAMTMNVSSSTLSLVGAATITGATTLTNGTLNLSGYTLTTGSFSSNNANIRAIQFGSQTIFLTSTVASTVVMDMSSLSNFTYTGTPNFSTAATVTRVFTVGVSGSTTANVPNLYITSGTGLTTGAFTANSYFNILDFTGSAGAPSGAVKIATSLTLASGGTYTGMQPTFVGNTGTFTTNGKSISLLTIAHSNTASVTSLLGALSTTGSVTLTSGILNLAGYSLTVATSFISTASGVRAIYFGTGTIFLTNGTAATTVLSMSNITDFTYTGTGGFSCTMSITRTFTCGVTGGTTTNAPNLSLTAGGAIPTLTTGGFFGILNFTGSTGTPSTTALNVNSLTLASGGTYTGLTINARGTGTITGNGKTIAALTINNSGLTVSLGSAITCSGIGTLTAGTLALVSYTLTVLTFNSSNSNTRAIQFGTGTLTASGTGTAFDATTATNLTTTGSGTINLTSASSKTFAGGGASYPTLNQGGAGTLTITGSSTFSNITNTVQPATVLFTAGTTSTFTLFSLTGTAGNLITIGSPTSAQHTLSKASGTVTVDYLAISYSNATGGATWNPGVNSIDGGNNSGWVFAAVANSNFFLLF